jgi:hypothetical protein
MQGKVVFYRNIDDILAGADVYPSALSTTAAVADQSSKVKTSIETSRTTYENLMEDDESDDGWINQSCNPRPSLQNTQMKTFTRPASQPRSSSHKQDIIHSNERLSPPKKFDHQRPPSQGLPEFPVDAMKRSASVNKASLRRPQPVPASPPIQLIKPSPPKPPQEGKGSYLDQFSVGSSPLSSPGRRDLPTFPCDVNKSSEKVMTEKEKLFFSKEPRKVEYKFVIEILEGIM